MTRPNTRIGSLSPARKMRWMMARIDDSIAAAHVEVFRSVAGRERLSESGRGMQHGAHKAFGDGVPPVALFDEHLAGGSASGGSTIVGEQFDGCGRQGVGIIASNGVASGLYAETL